MMFIHYQKFPSTSKSRRDDPLLTAGFNLRTENAIHLPKSRRDDTLITAGVNLRIN